MFEIQSFLQVYHHLPSTQCTKSSITVAIISLLVYSGVILRMIEGFQSTIPSLGLMSYQMYQVAMKQFPC